MDSELTMRDRIQGVAVGAAATSSGALAPTQATAAASTGSALCVAVEVVPCSAAAKLRAVNFPPATGDRAWRASVHPGDRAAELRVARRAKALATDGGIGGLRTENEVTRRNHHCGSHHCGFPEESATPHLPC